MIYYLKKWKDKYIHKMAEQTREEQYIKCSRCQMKYINNDDHIKKEFGYNRLNERYKTCIACRDNRKQYKKT